MNTAQLITDPAWRLQNFYKIVDKGAKQVRYKPNAVQERLNNEKASKRIVLKARQFGVSTNEILRLFDYTIWNRNTTTCILAHEQDAIEKLFRIARRAYDFMDEGIKPELDRGGGSKYEMRFPKLNSRIYCDLESRGDTIHWLHISEAAFFKDPDRMKSTMQAVPINGRVTIETTPNGMGNHFYDLWMDEKHPYKKLFYPWYLFPDYRLDVPAKDLDAEERELVKYVKATYQLELSPYQLSFRRMKKAELGLLFIQEYPEDDQSCFLASGLSAMDLVLVKSLLDAAPMPLSEEDQIKVYEHPVKDGVYVIGADCAEGVGGDSSVGVVIESVSNRQVAVLRCDEKPSDFAKLLVKLCNAYAVRGQVPLLAVERNNHGHAVIQELNEHLQYPNLFVDKDEKIGWRTDAVSRPIMMNAFIAAVENRRLVVQDSDTLKECLTLVNNKGKIEADEGKHDDCVIATAIAEQLAVESSKLQTLYSNIGSKILVG